MTNYYRSGTPSVSYYPSSSSLSEADMREELIRTLDGYHPEIAKGQTGLVRKIRLDGSGNPISCGCVDALTKEPDKDRFCPFCFGDGKMWDETEVIFYRIPVSSEADNALLSKLVGAGLISVPLGVFYIRYNAELTERDKLVELELNVDGTPVDPYRRHRIWRLERVWDYRADNGKLEYFKCFARMDSVKFLNAPTYSDLTTE